MKTSDMEESQGTAVVSEQLKEEREDDPKAITITKDVYTSLQSAGLLEDEVESSVAEGSTLKHLATKEYWILHTKFFLRIFASFLLSRYLLG